MSTIVSYLFLVLAVVLGTASNTFAKSAEGFTLWIPSIITAITIVLCMYSLSHVMKTIPGFFPSLASALGVRTRILAPYSLTTGTPFL